MLSLWNFYHFYSSLRICNNSRNLVYITHNKFNNKLKSTSFGFISRLESFITNIYIEEIGTIQSIEIWTEPKFVKFISNLKFLKFGFPYKNQN